MQCNVFTQFKGQKHIIFHILYIIVAALCPAFLKDIQCAVIGRILACDRNVIPFTIFGNSQRFYNMVAAATLQRDEKLCRQHLGGVMHIFQHIDVDLWGRVWMRHFGKAWMSLNFYKEYLFGFETLIFVTLWILYLHKQRVILQRQKKTWIRIIWPLWYFFAITKQFLQEKWDIRLVLDIRLGSLILNLYLVLF